MDPITQGALGATVGQVLAKPKTIVPASLMAALAGMSPDLDVLIRSSHDPLLFLVFHRQFTHSLFFIPFGALICALALHYFIGRRYQFSFWQSYLLCFAGYATHALLDACTTYGTLLLWPFSNERFAWNNLAVIDLFYTLPILFGLWWGIKKQSLWPARILLVWVFAYPLLGQVQKLKAEAAARLYLSEHFHENIVALGAKPTMSNLVLWKIVYETDSHYFVDALKIGIFEKPEQARYFSGDSIKKLVLAEDFPWLEPNSQQAKDVERFSWFSMGFVAKDDGTFTGMRNRIIDVRYSIVPNQINPLWSIGLDEHANATTHVSYENHRDTSKLNRDKFFSMLWAD